MQLEDFDQYVNKDGVGVFSCMICSYKQKAVWNVRNHVESKHFPHTFIYTCPICDKTFGSNNAFLWHKRSHK